MEGKKYLKVGFSDHADWLKEKNITTIEPLQISTERRKPLIQIIEQELLQLNDSGLDVSTRYSRPFKTGSFIIDLYNQFFYRPDPSFHPKKGFLKENAIESATLIANAVVPFLINNLEKEIKEKLESMLKNRKDTPITEAALVNFRSPPFLKRKDLYEDKIESIKSLFSKSISLDINHYNTETDILWITDHLFDCIMRDLVKTGDIFSFDPGYYLSECWVRY